jgi:hypothetical protein
MDAEEDLLVVSKITQDAQVQINKDNSPFKRCNLLERDKSYYSTIPTRRKNF